MREHSRERWFRRAIAVGVLAALGALGPEASAGVRIKRTLQPTAADPDAQGQAVLSIMHHGGLGKLSVRGRRLDPSATFGILVGGVRIGTLSTNTGGKGRASFSSKPGPRDQMLGVDPGGKHLEVTDENGEDVLDDDMPDDTEPGAMACCLPDGGETECEDLTPNECQNEGGMAPMSGAASCMPDPCATSSGEDTRCCLPNDGEAECEETTSAECSAEQGMDIGMGSCDPNPCMQPAPGVERCCIPQDDQGEQEGEDQNQTQNEPPECEQLTPAHCGDEGGKSIGAGSCDPNPCASPSGAFVDGPVSGL